ncbi:MAG: prepilin-type N-terminal cleavage/methylation domain-containing protein [Planctomycetes bacterium]|nr:prepilin-type N-terminal cleavage/methylation domain-containing protein [Planctomycetota bacterium]
MKTFKRKESRRQRRRAGFTLVELLIVMAILVLLVSLVGPRLLGSKKKADIGAAKTQIGLFEAALERFALDMGRFPTTEEGLQALITPPSSEGLDAGLTGTGAMNDLGTSDLGAAPGTSSTGASSSAASKWDGPYLRKNEIPLDPWGNPYQYEYPPTHGTGDQPDIWSLGPDGQDGTDDDITNWGSAAGGAEGVEGMDNLGNMPGGEQPLAPELPPQ